jgi:formylglycine-generating enzyme required for sulfatase activity
VGNFREKWDESWKNPAAVCDMAGNVWEWTDSWYDPWHQDKIIKGGSCYSSIEQSKIDHIEGFFMGAKRNDIGFRCAKDICE